MFLDVSELPLFISSLCRLCTPFPLGSIAHLCSPDRSPSSPLIHIYETSGNAPIQFLLIHYWCKQFLPSLFSNHKFSLRASRCEPRVVQPKNKVSLCFPIFQVQAFKMPARQKGAQGKPCSNAYFAIFHKHRPPVKKQSGRGSENQKSLGCSKSKKTGTLPPRLKDVEWILLAWIDMVILLVFFGNCQIHVYQ